MKNIAKRIEDFCEKHDIKKTHLARLLGVGNQAVYSWIAGRRKMDARIYENFCYLEKNPGDFGHSGVSLNAHVTKLCDEILISKSTSEDIVKRVINFLNTSSDAYSISKDADDQSEKELLEALTNFIDIVLGKTGAIKLIQGLTEPILKETEDDNLDDKTYLSKYQKKWANSPLSISDCGTKIFYKMAFSKERASEVRDDLIAIAKSAEDVRTKKDKEDLLNSLSSLTDEDLLTLVCQKYSIDTCHIDPFVYNQSGGVKLIGGILVDEWHFQDLGAPFPTWKKALKLMNARLKRVEAIKNSLLSAKYLFVSHFDTNSLSKIEVPCPSGFEEGEMESLKEASKEKAEKFFSNKKDKK